MKADYIVYQGEQLILSLIATQGEITEVATATALLKAAGPNGTAPGINAPTVATFQVQSADLPELGWKFILNDVDTALLKPGFYVTNAKLNLVAGGPLKTDIVLIEVKASVS